ncbi:DUF1700 domain-containing protein [Paenibacillus sp. alder61]|uniref:HAAS signaling domain-containing protein n=1 Tax=Paenibacillus sp. alder61 TaxID=2862948 RepID=UPI001CD381D4|nr:DUF1700 domain-containing protein [Paenibacillus sp. alder61]MCA1293868.1 DUF1700 domain-containing protein [Paenibacillus sp. alder61]
MKKETYLNELTQYLKSLPPDERAEAMADYREHFEMAELNGRSEEEIISRLGEPQLVARAVLAQFQIRLAGNSPSLASVTKAVLATVSLGLFNLVIVLIPFAASLAVLAGLFGIALFLMISPLLLIMQHPILTVIISDFFLMLGLVGTGLLLLVGTIQLTRLYYHLVIRYLKYNLKMMRRE